MRSQNRRARRKALAPRLSRRPLRARFLITDVAWDEVGRLLQTYRDTQGDHEGIVFLFGRRLAEVTMLTTAIAPDADTGPGHVHCNEAQMGNAVQAGRSNGVALLA